MNIRAFFQAATVENAPAPYNTLHLKVFYPAQPSDSPYEQDFGIMPADIARSPFKVVILFNGINCGVEGYQWLAVRLAERGLVVVTFSWIAENLPGIVALTPGVDVAMWAPGVYGTGSTASALPTLLAALERVQTDSVLAGLLDLDHIILGGHSAGGRVAIESANPQFAPQVVAAFAYGAHTAAIPQMGYEPGSILPLPDALPLLLIGGTCDGVIANSSDRYGVSWEQAATPVIRTFQDGIIGGRNDSYLLIIEGANHFSIVHPRDTTTGRAFLDFPTTQPDTQICALIAESIGLFIDAHVCSQPAALAALERSLTTPSALVAQFERR